MFKRMIALTAALVMAPAVMADNYHNRGGFQGPGATKAVVKVKDLSGFGMNDRPVILEGNITQQLNHEIYSFTDGTGSVNVEVDDEIPLPIFNSDTRVRIYGEVDSKYGVNRIDVDYLEVIEPLTKTQP